MNKYKIWGIILLFLDFIIKIIVKNSLILNKEYPFLFIIKLRYVENNGAAFSILEGNRVLFIIVAILVLFLIGYNAYYKKQTRYEKIGYLLLSLGIFSNLIDRLLYKVVIDYISVLSFPIFNIADIYITIGVIILLIIWLKEEYYVYKNRQ